MNNKETLEKAAKNESEYLADYDDKEMYKKGFIDGAKWQQEQDKNKYSEEDLQEAFENGFISDYYSEFTKWFEEFKNN